ncbi:MAG TPA: rRNA maturation RNase YbeY [Clostridia bacterium]|nr:rRNA maturation RNase YbeY [Clostridia bacterium]
MKKSDNIILDLDNRQDIIEVTREIKSLIKRCAATTLNMHNFPLVGSVSIILVDNPTIADINSEYRNVQGDTDVLSFPIINIDLDRFAIDELSNDIDPETGSVILGDIMISMDKAMQQAIDYGHSFQRELGFLVVHGMLHLLGYDHIVDADRDIMRAKEESILKNLELGRD